MSTKTYTFKVQVTEQAEQLAAEDGLSDLPEAIKVFASGPEHKDFIIPWDAAPEVETLGDEKFVVLDGFCTPNGGWPCRVEMPLADWVKDPPAYFVFTGTWDMFTELVGMGWEVLP